MATLLFGSGEGSQGGMAQSVYKQKPESREWWTQVGLWSFMHWISNDPSMRMIRPREIESSNIVRRHRSDDLCLPLLVGWCSDWEHILSLRFKQTERARRCARFSLSSLVWLWISAFKLRHPQLSAEFETFQYLQTTHYIQTTVLSPQDNGQVW